jgi:N-6 DNA Methylase
MNLVKSKHRVADHGEVFTPAWMVEAMLDLVKHETERIDSRFLEPACGSGNFLVPILRRKLAAVELKYGKSDFERRHYALLGVMCIYGIEILADNIEHLRRPPYYTGRQAIPARRHQNQQQLRNRVAGTRTKSTRRKTGIR